MTNTIREGSSMVKLAWCYHGQSGGLIIHVITSSFRDLVVKDFGDSVLVSLN